MATKKQNDPKTTVDMVNEAIDQADMSDLSTEAETEELSTKMQAFSEKLTSDVERYVSEGIETIQKLAGEYSDKIGDIANTAGERATHVYGESKEYVREYPVTTVLGAFAIGVLLGALVRRS